MRRRYSLALLGLILTSQYLNCSSYSDGSLYSGSPYVDPNSTYAYQGLKVGSGDTYMNCDEDHVQVGGTCNTGDAVDNVIEATITRDRTTTVVWGPNGNTQSKLRTSKCENGHFSVVIPRPNDSALVSTAKDYVAYDLKFQIYVKKTSTDLTYEAGEKSPAFAIYVQKNGGCN